MHKRQIALVIMAAGIGSRYGAGIKQLQQVGPHGEIIIDYSIYDALEAGFSNVVFIIRREIEAEFREAIGSRIEQLCPVRYVFQDKDDLPQGFACPDNRVKPWGTGQAVLACRKILDTPFAVINADDYYGKEAFRRVYAYLCEHYDSHGEYCMAGFQIQNTLSDNGTVTRGLCSMDEAGRLQQVTETHGIVRGLKGIEDENGAVIPEDTLVSMNMWGLTPEFIGILEDAFAEFLQRLSAEDTRSEFLLPTVIDQLIRSGQAAVQVLSTPDQWFGVTYAEDKDSVEAAFRRLIADGVYGERLWETHAQEP